MARGWLPRSTKGTPTIAPPLLRHRGIRRRKPRRRVRSESREGVLTCGAVPEPPPPLHSSELTSNYFRVSLFCRFVEEALRGKPSTSTMRQTTFRALESADGDGASQADAQNERVTIDDDALAERRQTQEPDDVGGGRLE